jgi:nucleoside-diphosphate-sugar epimerase
MTPAPLTLAVLGANGRLGSAVAAEAARRGHRTLAVTRGGTCVLRDPGIEPRAADATDPQALAAAVEGAKVVVNALNPVYTDWPTQALPMARAALSACRTVGAHHLFAGNVYAFGAGMPPVLRPETPLRPTSRKGAIRAEMRALVAEAARAGEVRSTILFAGDFFGGPNPRGSWLDLVLASKLGKGRVVHPGPMDVPHAWAYLPDLAAAFVDLAERASDLPDHATFGFPGHAPTGAELHAALEAATGRTLRRARLPWPLIRAAGLVNPTMREVAEMAYLWRVPHRIDGAALEAAIGRIPRTDLVEALRTALDGLARS